MIVTPPDGYTCKICGVKGHFIKDCPKKSQSTLPQANIKPQSCWFCLANPAVEKQLIVEYYFIIINNNILYIV